MKIAFVASEVVPFAKTGGLADVSGSLPPVISNLGNDVKVFMPKYFSIDSKKYDLKENKLVGVFPVTINGFEYLGKVFKGFLPDTDVEVYFIDQPYFFHRSQLYTNDLDEDARFVFFQKAVLITIQRLGWKPDIIHCNDWQTGLIPLYIKDNFSWDKLFEKTATVFTIHNIGYQGRFAKSALFSAEIDGKHFYPAGPAEYFDDVNFLKAALWYSDMINTVSEKYAEELLTEEYGSGMQDTLTSRKDDFVGILNGVDYEDWSPEKDKLIPQKYTPSTLENKAVNKKALCEKFELKDDPEIPVIGIVSRLATQKGFDLIEKAMNDLIKLNCQLVVLGSGEIEYEEMFTEFAEKHPEKIAIWIGYNIELSHLIEAGSDMFLMPSHYEPCGLNQIYSLRYGTVPIVRETGGLADTVINWNDSKSTGTGFSFSEYTPEAMMEAIRNAINLFTQKEKWKKIQENGMKLNFSWTESAKKYIELYQKAKNKRNL
ncbi:MAG: glycogen synthase GlgA [Melioribacteraceae bacterium]|nr:glycogen synthase GlgA [Melioribacteraceae bacterium]MCF8263171.1 glycogen synthase GlgA [Melioribacteraceae bacterium]MCF8430341.1 glycogen synthase GlgA [Melioribacteraceae bacterium]